MLNNIPKKRKAIIVLRSVGLGILVAISVVVIGNLFKPDETINIAEVKRCTNEYEQVLKDPELIEEYKATHAFMDDYAHYVEYTEGFDYVGYSRIWKVLVIGLSNDEARYYSNLPDSVMELFNLNDYSYRYYSECIEPYYPYTLPEDPNPALAEQYVTVKSTSQDGEN